MNAIPAATLLASTLLALAGCENEIPPSKEPTNKFQRGISGQGSVYQPDVTNDPIIREQSRVGN